MSKVEELRKRIVQCFATSGGPGLLDEYTQTVRDEEFALFEAKNSCPFRNAPEDTYAVGCEKCPADKTRYCP